MPPEPANSADYLRKPAVSAGAQSKDTARCCCKAADTVTIFFPAPAVAEKIPEELPGSLPA
jgi:hypothetical protein